MRFAALIIAASLSAASPWAGAAPRQGDDMERFLADRGLVGQIEQVRQQVQQVQQDLAERMSELVVHALGFLGVPYKRGGNSPEAGGLDCSGFVKAVYEQIAGLALPRRADQQAAATQTIDKSELKPGDLVFFNTMRRTFSHVGIYVGEGKFVHAPKPGAEIRVEDMRVAYWSRRFDGARRVPVGAPPAGTASSTAPAGPAGPTTQALEPARTNPLD